MKFSKIAYLMTGALSIGSFALSAHADVTVYTGYYDLPPVTAGNPSALPDPWVSSPNTIFNGSIERATLPGPDESAVLFHNSNAEAITLTSFSIISATYTYDIWGSYIGSGQIVAPGGNLIFSGINLYDMDGSDGELDYSTIYWTINGIAGSAKDVPINNGVDISLNTGVLTGSIYGYGNETLPWVQIATIVAVPEPETYALMIAGLGLIGFMARRKNIA